MDEEPARRFDLRGRSLREHAARGTLVNTAFMVGLSFLGFLKGFVLAALLTAADYGIWGVTLITLNLISQIQAMGIGDKFVQQDEADQEAAFHKAFTLQVLLSGVSVAAALVVLPGFSAIYGQPDMILPGLLLAVLWLLVPFQLPLWVHYRRMDFLRQRLISAIDPIVSFAVAIALAVAGAGYWALFGGAVAGSAAMSVVAAANSPYAFRWRFDRTALRDYRRFSAPLMVAALGGLVIAQASLLATEAHLGIAAAGALTLAATISQFTDRVDHLVTGTLYPAIVAVRDRVEVLYESFVKSNRLALMWAVPFGLGLTLFARDLVELVLGERWEPALPLLQAFGAIAAFGHLGFNWNAYMRARGDTWPIAVATAAAAVTFLVVAIPLLLLYDLPGLAVGLGVQTLVHVAFRAYFLRRIFSDLGFLRHAARAALPSLPPVALLVAVRAVSSGERGALVVVAELALYAGLTALLTWRLERPLLREALGYLHRREDAAAPA